MMTMAPFVFLVSVQMDEQTTLTLEFSMVRWTGQGESGALRCNLKSFLGRFALLSPTEHRSFFGFHSGLHLSGLFCSGQIGPELKVPCFSGQSHSSSKEDVLSEDPWSVFRSHHCASILVCEAFSHSLCRVGHARRRKVPLTSTILKLSLSSMSTAWARVLPG